MLLFKRSPRRQDTDTWPSIADYISSCLLFFMLFAFLMLATMQDNNMGDDVLHFREPNLDTIKSEILDQIVQKLKNEGLENVSVEGSRILIDESVLFDSNSSEIKSTNEANKLSMALGNAFYELLNDKEISKYIFSINIEGHADTDASSMHNRTLSSNRAANFLNKIFTLNPKLESEKGWYFGAVGYSEFRPYSYYDFKDPSQFTNKDLQNVNSSNEQKKKNRRIEIRIEVGGLEEQ